MRLTLNKLIVRTQQLEVVDPDEQAYYGRSGTQNMKGKKKQKPRCWNCGKRSHTQDECTSKTPPDSDDDEPRQLGPQGFARVPHDTRVSDSNTCRPSTGGACRK